MYYPIKVKRNYFKSLSLINMENQRVEKLILYINTIYGVDIDKEHMCLEYVKIYDEFGNIKYPKYYLLFNNFFKMFFKNDFDTLLKVSDKFNPDTVVTHNDTEIETLKNQIKTLHTEIQYLTETNNELRDSYWNLKHNN